MTRKGDTNVAVSLCGQVHHNPHILGPFMYNLSLHNIIIT